MAMMSSPHTLALSGAWRKRYRDSRHRNPASSRGRQRHVHVRAGHQGQTFDVQHAARGDAERHRIRHVRAAEAGRWFEEAKQSVTLRSHDGWKLRLAVGPGLFRPTAALPRSAPGYTGKPTEMAKWAHRYAQLGLQSCYPRSALN